MTRYTAKQIEDAALICQIRAADWSAGKLTEAISEQLAAIGASTPAHGLVLAVWEAANSRYPTRIASGYSLSTAIVWAEAESWIRSGWREPGDELEFTP